MSHSTPTPVLLAALLALPLLLPACNKNGAKSPTAAVPSEERQAAGGTSPQDRMLQSNPPAAGPGSGSTPDNAPSTSSTPGRGSEPPDSSSATPGSAPSDSAAPSTDTAPARDGARNY